MALLVQKEVAERVAAQPGDMSLLSVSVQYYCEAELDRVVPAALFTPPPKVDSQILKLTYRTKPLFKDVDTKKFFQIIKAGFSQRRKKLRSSLSAGLHMEKGKLEGLLQKAGISPDRRPQELSLDDWYALYQAL
jgi:16S rRNA (adenine1518-N6/adenine1519-N6)-dimethyltransferase